MPQTKCSIAALVLSALLLLLSGCAGKSEDPREMSAQIAEGISYLQYLEEQDPNRVDDIRKEQQQQRMQELREERMAELEIDEDTVWSLFEDYVLLGDSRAVGFSYYEFLPESRVLAEGGATILTLEEHIPDLVQMRPGNLFLCYGLNDVSIGYWDTPEKYAEAYAEVIAEIRDALPGVHIYISSILPARDPAFETSSAWYRIPEYSAAVKAMCEETGCVYVDNDELAEEYADLWDLDGIHLRREFYSHWAANMITAAYSQQLEEELEEEFAEK